MFVSSVGWDLIFKAVRGRDTTVLGNRSWTDLAFGTHPQSTPQLYPKAQNLNMYESLNFRFSDSVVFSNYVSFGAGALFRSAFLITCRRERIKPADPPGFPDKICGLLHYVCSSC